MSALKIIEECEQIKTMLLAKNEAYGDSALDPMRVFSDADPAEQIRVRIDDKLSRLQRGRAVGEDVTLDLIGYLVLLRIAERRSPPASKPEDSPYPAPAGYRWKDDGDWKLLQRGNTLVAWIKSDNRARCYVSYLDLTATKHGSLHAASKHIVRLVIGGNTKINGQ